MVQDLRHFQRDALLARLDAIDAECGDGFPLHALGDGQPWVVSPGGSWTGGFWAACFWLRATLTGSATDRAKAGALCARLAPKLSSPTGHRAFLFWYGAALGARWCGDARAMALAGEAATALCQDFSDTLRAIPLGTALGGGPTGTRRVSIDALAPTLMLLTQHGDAQAQDVARWHTDSLLLACGTSEGGFHTEAEWDGRRWHGLGIAGDWSRGQAWAMLGTCTAAALWGQPYLAVAERAAAHWLRTRRAFPPLFRQGLAEAVDPAAAVIALHALRMLADLQDDDSCAQAAEKLLQALLSSPWFDSPGGKFMGCCLPPSHPAEQPRLAETTWGTFMLLSALNQSVPR